MVRAKIAATSFNGNAAAWWNAHARRQPRLLVTYDQLLEWLKCELVPAAGVAASHLAWHDLTYEGDIEKYLQKLTSLLIQHPLDPKVAHTLAARPFSNELMYRILSLDQGHGVDGMSIPQLRTQIKNFVLEKEASSGFVGWKKTVRPAAVKNAKA